MRHTFLQSYLKLQGILNNNTSWLPHEDDLIFHLQRKNIGWRAGKKCEIRFWKCFHHKCALFKSQYCPWSWRITCYFQNNSSIPFSAYACKSYKTFETNHQKFFISLDAKWKMNNVSVNVFPVSPFHLIFLVSPVFLFSPLSLRSLVPFLFFLSPLSLWSFESLLILLSLCSFFYLPYSPAYCSVERSEEHIMNGLGSPLKTTLRNWSVRGMRSFKQNYNNSLHQLEIGQDELSIGQRWLKKLRTRGYPSPRFADKIFCRERVAESGFVRSIVNQIKSYDQTKFWPDFPIVITR